MVKIFSLCVELRLVKKLIGKIELGWTKLTIANLGLGPLTELTVSYSVTQFVN